MSSPRNVPVAEWTYYTKISVDGRTKLSYKLYAMSEIARLVSEFGGVRPLADRMTEVLGKKIAPSTVQYWVEVGYVPQKRVGDVLRVAEAHGKTIRQADLYQPLPDAPAPAQKSSVA